MYIMIIKHGLNFSNWQKALLINLRTDTTISYKSFQNTKREKLLKPKIDMIEIKIYQKNNFPKLMQKQREVREKKV